ncbi:MAG: hypothetical protein AMS25_01230 [Gemmatimonas sp. SM23_52]|nr:MAG: hypothetical protein AMS25_01230 [Gemmatimonas sp. SM23_52]
MQAPPILPIDVTSVIGVIMGSLVILIPIAGITLRFAIKPIAEAMAKIREGQRADRETALLQQRVDLLEQQLAGMESELHRLREVQEFHARLKAPEE